MKVFTNKWGLLTILALTWGSSFILIKHSVSVFTPIQVGALRLVIAGLVLAAFGIRNFKYIPKRLFPWVVFGGCLGNFIPMFLFPIAQKEVSSSMAGILDSLVPVFVMILGFLLFKIKSSKSQMLGAAIGFLGAFILMGSEEGGLSSSWLYMLLIILATVFYAMNGLIISRYLTGLPSFKLSSVVFTIWLVPSLLILGGSGFFADFSATETQLKGLGYVSVLALIGTAIAMILYYKLIQQTSAVFAASVTYLMPIVAVIWGVLDGEELHFAHFLGAGLILFGVYLIQEKPNKKQLSFQ